MPTPLTEWQPSTVLHRPWVFATRPQPPDERPLPHGCWLLWMPQESIDDTWTVIREAVERGELGYAAKCMTGGVERFQARAFVRDRTERLIVIYTRMERDDAIRVRDALRKLGITWQLSWRRTIVSPTERFE